MGPINIRSVYLAYDLIRGGKDLVVFIHGVGSDRTAWKYQLSPFAEAGFSVLAIDMRGSGDSEARGESGIAVPISLEEFALDVDALITELGYDGAHWVGNSMGGVTILKAIELGLPTLKKIVLSNTFAKHPNSREILPRASSALRMKSLRDFAIERMPQMLKPDASQLDLSSAILAMSRKDPEAYLASWKATWSPDFRNLLPTITNPTLVVSATLDKVTPIELSEELAAGIKGARHITIKSAGHMSNLDQPDEFNAAVIRFLLA